MSKMKIWHTVKGGSEVLTEDSVEKLSVPMRVKQIQTDGGFWTDTTFVPWSSITYVEFEKAPEDVKLAAKPGVAGAPPAPPAPPAPKAAYKSY